MNIDIIVPTFNQEDFTIKCFESIRNYTDKYTIIWVDNGSTINSRNKVIYELSKHKSYKCVFLNENYGFVKATNEGIKYITSEYTVFLNNDTQVTPFWKERLLTPLLINDLNMATGPITNADGSWQGWQNLVKKHDDFKDVDIDIFSKTENDIALYLYEYFNNKVIYVKMLAFFCTMFKSKIFKEIGVLDEIFGVGFGDDDDFCKRITNNGYNLVFCPNTFIYHHHRTTFKEVFGEEKYKEMASDNLNLYYKKHNIKGKNNG